MGDITFLYCFEGLGSWLRVFAFSFIVTVSPFPSPASVMLQVDGLSFDANVLASYDPQSYTGYQWRDSESGRRDLGQSFYTSSDVSMESFSVRAEGNVQSGASGSSFAVTVFESQDVASIGEPVFSQSDVYLTQASNPVDGKWLTFDIDNIQLTAGRYYTVMLSWDTSNVTGQYQGFAISSEGDYTGGRLWESADGVTYTSSVIDDLLFNIQLKPVTVSYNALHPVNCIIDEFVPTSGSGMQWRDNEVGERDIGQSFLMPYSALVDSFSFQAAGNLQSGAYDAPFTIGLFESAGNTSMGEEIFSQAGLFLSATNYSIDGGWLTFDIGDVYLSEGKVYTFFLSFDEPSVTGQNQGFYCSSEGYTDGRLWQENDGADPVYSSSYDLAFSVQGVPVGLGYGSQPLEQVLTSYISGSSSGYQWRDSENGRRDLGQSFLAASDVTLDSFSFCASGNIQLGASEAPYTVMIFESTDSSVIGDEVMRQAGVYFSSSSNPVDGNWITFDIENLNLSAGKYYTMMLSWDYGSVTGQYQGFATDSGGYANGRRWESADGAAYTSSSTADLLFSVQLVSVEFSGQSATVGYVGAQPDRQVLADFSPSSGAGFQWRDNETSQRDIGQSFLISDDSVLDSVSLKANGNVQFGASEADYTITMYESSDAAVLGYVVQRQHGCFLHVGENPVDGGWIVFDIEDINVYAGNYYTFILSFDESSVTDQDQGFLSSTQGYTDGRLWQSNDGGAFTSSTSYDFAFSVGSVPVVVSSESDAPDYLVLTEFLPSSGTGLQWRDNEVGERDIGQSFKAPSDSRVESFSMQSVGNVQVGADDSEFTVTIFESTNSAEIGTAILVQSGNFLTTEANPLDGEWVTFDIDNFAVSAGKYYTFMLSWDNPTVADQDQGFCQISGGYAEGRLWQSANGAEPSSSTSYDCAFSVEMSDAFYAPTLSFNGCVVDLPEEARFICAPRGEVLEGWFRVKNISDLPQTFSIDLSLHTPDLGAIAWQTSPLSLSSGEEQNIALPDYLVTYGLYRLDYRVVCSNEVSNWGGDIFCFYPSNSQPQQAESVMPIGFATGSAECTPRLMALAETLGMEFHRFNAPWNTVQPSSTTWDWTEMDRRISLLQQYGFRWHAMTSGSASWAASELTDPPNATAWADWVSALATRYGDDIEFWEVWNEPNIGFFTGTVEEYAEVQRIAHDEIKAVDTNIVVTSGGYAGMNHWASKEGAFEAALNDYPRGFDWFAYHMHDVFSQFYSDLHYQLAALRQSTGTTDMPIVFTETGFDTRYGQRFQAQTLVKKLSYAAAIGAKSYCVYNLMDRSGADDPNLAGKSFGLITNPTGTDDFEAIQEEIRPKESFVAIATAVEELRRLPPVSIWAEEDAEYAFLFGVANDYLVVAWREDERVATPVWVVDGHGADVTCLDLFGNPESLSAVEDHVLLTLDEPQYFLFQGSSVAPSLMSPLVTLPDQITPDANNVVQVDLEVWNPLAQSVTVTAQVDGGKDITVLSQPAAQTLSSQSNGTFAVSIRVDPKALGETTEFTVSLSFDGLSWNPEIKIPVLFNTIDAVEGDALTLDSMEYVTNKQDYDPNSLHLLWGSALDMSVAAEFSIVDSGNGISMKYTVTDNVLFAVGSTETILDGDALELAWVSNGETNHMQIAAEMGTAPRTEFYRDGQISAEAVVDSVTVSRSGTRTTYDVVLDASNVAAGGESSIRFNFAVHDHDGEGSESWISPASGMGGADYLSVRDFLVLKLQ